MHTPQGTAVHFLHIGNLLLEFIFLEMSSQKQHKVFRINHISWWKEEVPNIQEYEYALDNLLRHRTNNFLITHEAPAPILSTFSYPYNQTSFENS